MAVMSPFQGSDCGSMAGVTIISPLRGLPEVCWTSRGIIMSPLRGS